MYWYAFTGFLIIGTQWEILPAFSVVGKRRSIKDTSETQDGSGEMTDVKNNIHRLNISLTTWSREGNQDNKGNQDNRSSVIMHRKKTWWSVHQGLKHLHCPPSYKPPTGLEPTKRETVDWGQPQKNFKDFAHHGPVAPSSSMSLWTLSHAPALCNWLLHKTLQATSCSLTLKQTTATTRMTRKISETSKGCTISPMSNARAQYQERKLAQVINVSPKKDPSTRKHNHFVQSGCLRVSSQKAKEADLLCLFLRSGKVWKTSSLAEKGLFFSLTRSITCLYWLVVV